MRRTIAVMGGVAVGLTLVGCGGGAGGNSSPKATGGNPSPKAAGANRSPKATGDYSSPKATTETMVTALKAGDWDLTLSCFDKNAREAVGETIKLVDEMKVKLPAEHQGTLEAMDIRKTRLARIKNAPKPTFGDEKIDGDKATLAITSVLKGKENKEKVNFVREDGQWKILLFDEDEIKLMRDSLPANRAMFESIIKDAKAR